MSDSDNAQVVGAAACGVRNGSASCARPSGHPGFHIDGGTVWGTSSKGYPMDPERTYTIPAKAEARDE